MLEMNRVGIRSRKVRACLPVFDPAPDPELISAVKVTVSLPAASFVVSPSVSDAPNGSDVSIVPMFAERTRVSERRCDVRTIVNPLVLVVRIVPFVIWEGITGPPTCDACGFAVIPLPTVSGPRVGIVGRDVEGPGITTGLLVVTRALVLVLVLVLLDDDKSGETCNFIFPI